MSTDKEKSSREELEACFNAAVEFIGSQWLHTQYETQLEENDSNKTDIRNRYTPNLIKQYQSAGIYLGKLEDKFPEILPEGRPNQSALKFTNFGRYIRNLDGATVVSPDEKIIDKTLKEIFRPRLRNPDEYEQTVYEIQVGSMYSQVGESVYFIEEGNTKAPDILIDRAGKNIKIECKRCGLPGARAERKGIYESLINKLTANSHAGAIFIIDLNRQPTPQEAQEIDHYLPDDITRRTSREIPAPFGEIHVIPYSKLSRIKPVPTGGLNQEESLALFYDFYILPEIYTRFGEEIGMHEFEQSSIRPAENKVAVTDTKMEYYDPMFIGIRYEARDDLVQPVINQFNKARKKFKKDNPNILHIDVPFLDDLSKEEFVNLHQRIRGKLNVNRRISAVSLTSEIIERKDPNMLDFAIICGSEENHDPYVEIPSDFDFRGYSLENMRENPMFK